MGEEGEKKPKVMEGERNSIGRRKQLQIRSKTHSRYPWWQRGWVLHHQQVRGCGYVRWCEEGPGTILGSKLKHRNNLVQEVIKSMAEPTLNNPGIPPSNGLMLDKILWYEMWEIEFPKYHTKLDAWKEGQSRYYQLVLAHCYSTVEEKLEASSKWETINVDKRIIPVAWTDPSAYTQA